MNDQDEILRKIEIAEDSLLIILLDFVAPNLYFIEEKNAYRENDSASSATGWQKIVTLAYTHYHDLIS